MVRDSSLMTGWRVETLPDDSWLRLDTNVFLTDTLDDDTKLPPSLIPILDPSMNVYKHLSTHLPPPSEKTELPPLPHELIKPPKSTEIGLKEKMLNKFKQSLNQSISGRARTNASSLGIEHIATEDISKPLPYQAPESRRGRSSSRSRNFRLPRFTNRSKSRERSRNREEKDGHGVRVAPSSPPPIPKVPSLPIAGRYAQPSSPTMESSLSRANSARHMSPTRSASTSSIMRGAISHSASSPSLHSDFTSATSTSTPPPAVPSRDLTRYPNITPLTLTSSTSTTKVLPSPPSSSLTPTVAAGSASSMNISTPALNLLPPTPLLEEYQPYKATLPPSSSLFSQPIPKIQRGRQPAFPTRPLLPPASPSPPPTQLQLLPIPNTPDASDVDTSDSAPSSEDWISSDTSHSNTTGGASLVRGRSSIRRKAGKDPRVGVARYRDILLRDGSLPSSSPGQASSLSRSPSRSPEPAFRVGSGALEGDGDGDGLYQLYQRGLSSDDISPFSSGRTSFSNEGSGSGVGDISIGAFDIIAGIGNGTGTGTGSGGKKGIGNMTMSSQKPKSSLPPIPSSISAIPPSSLPIPPRKPTPIPITADRLKVQGEGEADDEEGRYSDYSTASYDGTTPFLSDQLSKEYRERFLQRIDLQRLEANGGRLGPGVAGRSAYGNRNGSSDSLGMKVRFAA
ncbi:hypothetical protein SISSUDRAFT_1048028 [Sistotremastrum suecicum HHB10207 ss-3]|uniref:Uncharacterized protein n=1 Tax=Sistotremastrum suecicum HHB10207 ss-3 TaxID=1314776 RepID=A0A166CTY4_9AGAM|nr:hypothetical protein SISSUDRAFT_1048028 [Sistotremastrum suecicum HHB10207 ss-3]